jgi:hypothetical protein
MHPLDNMTEPELRDLTTRVCRGIQGTLPPQTGFAVVFFPFGEPGIGQYGGNCRREDIIKSLRETADRLEAQEDIPR